MHLRRFLAPLFSAIFLCAMAAFICLEPVQALLGDVDISGVVSQPDLAILDAAYKSDSPPGPPNWDWRADINLDEFINLRDLALIGRSYGDSFNFHWQRRLSNGRLADPGLSNPTWVDAAIDPFQQVHVLWIEQTIAEKPLYYTRLDLAGNTLIEDVLVSDDGYQARLAADSSGSAHIVYRRPYSSTGIFYSRVSPAGYPSLPFQVCSSCSSPALAVDEYNHVHVMYQAGNKAQYTILGTDSGMLLPAARMNPGIERTPTAFAVAVSSDGARHLLWRQASGIDGGDLRYTRISRDGVVTINNVVLAHLTGTYNDRRYSLAVDSYNAAHAVYYDNRGTPGSIYWRRVNPDGSFSTERLVTSSAQASAGLDISFEIDAHDQIHLLAPYRTSDELGYARLGRDGSLLVPYQRAVFLTETTASLVVSPAGEAMVVAASNATDASGSQPLFMVSTIPDPAANDTQRTDLVVDEAHLSLANATVRINESASLTVTVTNGGWVQALNNVLTFSFPLPGGMQGQVVHPLPDLEPFESTTVENFLLPVPDFSDQVTWPITISVSSATQETSLGNNQVVARFAVIPPPVFFNLEAAPFDETYAPDDPTMSVPFPGTRLELNCPSTGYSQVLDPAAEYNVFWEIPLDMESGNVPLFETPCDVSAQAHGYSTTMLRVTARRYSEADPYRIVIDPSLPLKLYLNSWGSITGTVSDESGPLEAARITLDDGRSVDTGPEGRYAFVKVPAGAHSLSIWRRDYTPITGVVTGVIQGEAVDVSRQMTPTKRAEVFGTVSNIIGWPLAGASVTISANPGFTAQVNTGSDGSYQLAVEDYGQYTDYRLEINAVNYDNEQINLPSLYPGWPLQQDVLMTYTASGGLLEQHSSATSWAQDERWCSSYDDDVPWREQVLEFIGSEWCPEYHVNVDWGEMAYSLALHYVEDIETNILTTLAISFENEPFISYEVGSGMWSGGGESRTATGERIDWVELVALDTAGNPVAVPLWSEDEVWYSTDQEDPYHAFRELQINTPAGEWSLAGIRVFYTIGQYDVLEDHHWKNWNPPADLGLAGSGAPSGADRQVLTWWLEPNTLTQRYSLADYRSALDPDAAPDLPEPQPLDSNSPLQPADDPGPVDIPTAVEAVSVSVTAVSAGPARLGAPYMVDLYLTGGQERPVYAIEFDLDFNPTYLRLIAVQAAPDFSGPGGSHLVPLYVAAANAAGLITDSAVVRLGAPAGLSEGRILRLVFMPVQKTASTTLDLKNVTLSDLDSDLFSAEALGDLAVTVADARVFIPLVVR